MSAASSLDERRRTAGASFDAGGIPHRRVEDWKYSDLRSALPSAIEPASLNRALILERDGIPDLFGRVAGPQIILSNGYFDAAASKGGFAWSEDLEIFDLKDAFRTSPAWVRTWLGAANASSQSPLADASLSMMAGGIALRVKPNVQLSAPLHLLHLLADRNRNTGVNSRVLLLLEEASAATILESRSAYQNTKTFANLGVEIILAPGAQLKHIRIAHCAPELVEVEDISVRVGKCAEYSAHFANFGAKLSRTEVHVGLVEESATAKISGVNVLRDAHADVTTRIDHVAGNTQSVQLFKNVAGGKSRAVYQGKISVHEGADGSDSRQTAKGLLLDPRGEIDLKPELEILADDVKCAHGAAAGDLDSEALFYLRARGIPEAEARGLLIRAFLEDAVDEIENESIRAAVWEAVEAALMRATEVRP